MPPRAKPKPQEPVQLDPRQTGIIPFDRKFDPIPPWWIKDPILLDKFARIQIEFRMQELKLEQEKLEKVSQLLAPSPKVPK